MKVEFINENKIKITLTFEELEKRDISLKDITNNSSLARDLFTDLIEETDLDSEFFVDDSQLLIEACSDNNNLFIVTITKINDFPELKKYTKRENKSNTKTNKITRYKVDSNVFSFNSIDDILDLCTIAKKENLYFGWNSLYKYNDTYFLIFTKNSIKNKKFLKTYVILSEFCNTYYSYDIYEVSIKEKSKLIIKNNALQKLINI